jgi:hypothetical protein
LNTNTRKSAHILLALSIALGITATIPEANAAGVSVPVNLPQANRNVGGSFNELALSASAQTIHVTLPTFNPTLNTPGLNWAITDYTGTTVATGTLTNGTSAFDLLVPAEVSATPGSYQLTVNGGEFTTPLTADVLQLSQVLNVSEGTGDTTVVDDMVKSNSTTFQTQYMYDINIPRPVANAGDTIALTGVVGAWTVGPEGTWTSPPLEAGIDMQTCSDCWDTYYPLSSPGVSPDGSTLNIQIPTVLFTGRFADQDLIQVSAGGVKDSVSWAPDVVVNMHVTLNGGVTGMVNKTRPSVKGVGGVGQTLTVNPGTWSPAALGGWEQDPNTFNYQWLQNGVAIKGATHATYKVTALNLGKTLSVRVTGNRVGYTPATAVSFGMKVSLKAALAYTTRPKVTGTYKTGKTLSVSKGVWNPSATTVRYQWLKDGVAIPGATKGSLALTKAMKGHKVSVRVTATHAGYVPGVYTSTGVKVL